MWMFVAFIWVFQLSFGEGISSNNNITYRLFGGSFPNEGVVEVFYNGTWGRICSDWWDFRDAKVACRSLRLPPATYALRRHKFGTKTSKTRWTNRLQCSGNETTLAECPHAGWGNVKWCWGSAGVVCGHPEVHKINITNPSEVITSPGYPRYMTQAHYEWTFRPSIPNAMVLLSFEDINFDRGYYNSGQTTIIIKDAKGIQLLNFTTGNNRRVVQSRSILIEANPGKVIYISPFSSRRNYGGGFRMQYLAFNNGSPTDCRKNWTVTAQSGTGNFNVTFNPVYQTNSYRSFVQDAYKYLVLCNSTRGIGYAVAGNSSVGSVSVSVDTLHPDTSYSVKVFAYFSSHNYSSFLHSCLIHGRTNNVTYRLFGGSFPNEGAVEVFYNGTWGGICSDWWDFNDAKVICRSLRLPPATYAIRYNVFYLAVNKMRWKNRLQCSGNETSLAECPHDGWRNVSYFCYPAGVMCGNPEGIEYTGYVLNYL